MSKASQHEREAAKRYWQSLDDGARWLLGDQLVLGEFDWRDWFERKPSSVFMNQLDTERIHWEAT